MKDKLKNIKEKYQFHQLPGKQKKLIAGYRLRLSKLPLLEDFYVKSQSVHYFGKLWARRIIVLRNKKTDRLSLIRIVVAQKNCSDAHEALFKSYQLREREITLYPGQEQKIDVGDFCFLPRIKPHISMIDFVRNNIVVKISRRMNKGLDVIKLAKGIDKILKKEPTYKNLEESKNLPVIKEFSSDKTTLSSGARADLKINVSDPEKSEVTYKFDPSSGSINRDPKTPGLYYYRASNKRGSQRILLYAINERNLASSAEISINILRPYTK